MESITNTLGAPSAEALKVLLALLPGLVTVAIVYALTVRQVLSPLERIIQALLYTFLNHVVWQIVLGILYFMNWHWAPSAGAHLIGLGICGVATGLGMTWIINRGWLHDQLRSKRWGSLTKRTSRPNEWYDAFYRHEEYVVLHMKDGRSLFGWPRLYPDTADQGHLLLEDAEWLSTAEYKPAEIRLTIMVSASQVEFVEFVPRPEGRQVS